VSGARREDVTGAGNEATAAKLPVARNTLLLSASMAALYGMVQLSTAIATVTFVAVTNVGGLAGLGPAIFLATAALAAFPMGRAMDRFGRIPVLATGYGVGIAGSVLTGLGALWTSAVLVVVGFVLIGLTTGAAILTRTAAADMYPPERRAWGISLVLFGAVFGALLGPLVFVPLTAGRSPDAGSPVAPWFAAAVFMVIALALVSSVRPDPRRIAEILAARADTGGDRATEPAAPLSEIVRRRGAVPTLLAALTSYSVMVGMMTLSGYILVGHGHHQGAVFPVISAHFVGMFGLVLFVGRIIDRVGRRQALMGGLLLLGLSVLAVVWTVHSVVLTSLALFGIGLGWNFSFVAATAELVDLTSPVERGRILGFNDLLSGLLGATLALLGGVALAAIGLVGLGVAGLILTIVPVLLILGLGPKSRPIH
jgi:MFS family permease